MSHSQYVAKRVADGLTVVYHREHPPRFIDTQFQEVMFPETDLEDYITGIRNLAIELSLLVGK